MEDNNTIQIRSVGLSGLGGVESMKKRLEENLLIRKVIIDFVNEHFERGVDYGIADDRSKKDSLLKPGAEKICHLFNTHPEWIVDHDTWETLGKPTGTICMVCRIVDNTTGVIVGEGRGAETVGNKQRDSNKSIKNAEKCSLIDAALYTFMLSDRFTQPDGGNEAKTLLSKKRELFDRITDVRKYVNSDLTNNQFCVKMCESILKKKSINTLKEIDIIYGSINDFDLETGDRIPQNI